MAQRFGQTPPNVVIDGEPQARKIGDLVSLDAGMKELGLTIHAGRRWVLLRKIGYVKVGSRIMLPRAEIERIKIEGYIPPAVSERQ